MNAATGILLLFDIFQSNKLFSLFLYFTTYLQKNLFFHNKKSPLPAWQRAREIVLS
jgi:hypothetical protein